VQTDFYQEIDRLEILGDNPSFHKQIMIHLAAIVIEDRCRILFPWAWTDLNAFFKMRPADYPNWLHANEVTPYNVLSEAESLGGALEFLHENIYVNRGNVPMCHMDLKPENIVLTEIDGIESERKKHPLGLWKITDFGIAALIPNGIQSMGQVMRSVPSEHGFFRREVGAFQAPEAERRGIFRDGSVNHKKADIWSFGCVFAEAMAFSIRGPAGNDLVRSVRRRGGNDADGINRPGYFYRCDAAEEYQLLPELDRLFEDLAGHNEPRRGWIQHIWSLLKDRALVIRPETRDSAKNLCEKLNMKIQHSVPRVCLLELSSSPSQVPELSISISDTSSQTIALPEFGDFTGELSKRKLEPKFVTIAPDCEHILWSDEKRVLCSRRPSGDRPLHFQEYRGTSHSSIGRESVQIAGSILALKEGYREVSDIRSGLRNMLLTFTRGRSAPKQSIVMYLR
jgi:serine/threonine protein kinase